MVERQVKLLRVRFCARVHLFLRLLTEAFSVLRKTPVDSTTYRAPALPQGISAGFMLTWMKEKENFNRAQVAGKSVAMTADCKHHCHVPLENGYGVVINNQLAVLLSDFTLEAAVSGIIFKHVGLKKTDESDRFRVSLYFEYHNNTLHVQILCLEKIP